MRAFLFKEWQAGVIGGLPQPHQGFGLLLRDTNITDAGLKELSGLTSLQVLGLGNSQVTDAGVAELAKLKSLQTLFLRGAKVTEVGVAELRTALPEVKIIR